ncbi:hypothetical protein GCM10027361_29000 [Erwinia aphidicola]|jgi:DNA-binding winged helix-turn-helix (wHTH) protein|uniref:winged helix-turn-helix domain-containing protein n=1 Tax=Erwinia aphidicola TaxID=68334 RepID=UPI001745D9D0|nr:winged helix-turn-helix domain-containing protein [Erwinia aphidicola]MBD1377626.1 winged helix-turn-helix domain-containing protein [Erwinia aphidicola]
MYFILNKGLKFNPDVNEISLINDQHNSVVLSKPATRLLLTLIQNANNVVTRDFLLKNVWEDYGYTPSNNNLYMAISELRKAFTSLWKDIELIKTIPKVGLTLEAAIDVFEIKDGVSNTQLSSDTNPAEKEINSETVSLVEVEELPVSDNELETYFLKDKRSHVKIKALISLAIVIPSILYFISTFERKLPIGVSKDEYAFKYGTCDVFSHDISLGHVPDKEIFKSNIIEKLKQYDISCINVKKNIYYQTTFGRGGNKQNYFIAACTYIHNSDSRKCETIHEFGE